MLTEIFVLFLFGAPAAILSLLLAALGVWKKWLVALIVAGMWTVPATFYLSAVFDAPLYVIALFQFGATYAVGKGKPRVAWLLLIPLFLFTLFTTVLTSLSLFAPNRP